MDLVLRISIYHLLYYVRTLINIIPEFFLEFYCKVPFCVFEVVIVDEAHDFLVISFCEVTTMEFPLSAFEIVALFLISFSLIWFNILFSFLSSILI